MLSMTAPTAHGESSPDGRQSLGGCFPPPPARFPAACDSEVMEIEEISEIHRLVPSSTHSTAVLRCPRGSHDGDLPGGPGSPRQQTLASGKHNWHGPTCFPLWSTSSFIVEPREKPGRALHVVGSRQSSSIITKLLSCPIRRMSLLHDGGMAGFHATTPHLCSFQDNCLPNRHIGPGGQPAAGRAAFPELQRPGCVQVHAGLEGPRRLQPDGHQRGRRSWLMVRSEGRGGKHLAPRMACFPPATVGWLLRPRSCMGSATTASSLTHTHAPLPGSVVALTNSHPPEQPPAARCHGNKGLAARQRPSPGGHRRHG